MLCKDCRSYSPVTVCPTCAEYRAIMSNLNVPVFRIQATESNANWFLRSGWTVVSDLTKLSNAREAARRLLSERYKYND